MKNKRLVWYLEKKKKNDTQIGFRKKRSTIDALSKITPKIFNKFRRKEGTAAFFYIKKTNNKINRKKTFKQLENMGIQG